MDTKDLKMYLDYQWNLNLPTPILRRYVFLPSYVEQFHSLVLDSEKPKMAENKIADDK